MNEIIGLNQIFLLLIIMAVTATLAGFFAGFFGIGGGIITVPCLFYIFESVGVDKSIIMHLAVGTSFAIIIPTAVMSVYTHYKHKAVDFNILKTYGIFVVAGVVLGASFAASMETKSLVLFFSIILLFLGIHLFFIKERNQSVINEMKLQYKIILGSIVGFISAIMGIGGAIMNVPILKFFGYSINKAIGSAAAIGFFIASFGALGFLISGNYLNTNLPLSIGFISIPAFLIFIPITTFMARVGAKTVHRIDKKKINKLFGIFLIIVAIKFWIEFLSL